VATKDQRLDDSGEDLADAAGKQAVRFAVLAIALDGVLLGGPVAVARLIGTEVRDEFQFLQGFCLTWSFWAPLILAAVSTGSILLAFRVPAYTVARGSVAGKLATLARVLAVLVTIGWLVTTLAVAYINPTICERYFGWANVERASRVVE